MSLRAPTMAMFTLAPAELSAGSHSATSRRTASGGAAAPYAPIAIALRRRGSRDISAACAGPSPHARSREADNVSVSSREPRRRTRSRRLGLAVGATLLGGALVTEVRKPAAERTWHGRVAGRIPYDLRRPTLARVRDRLWNPADHRVLVPTVFGVGWTINLGRVLEPWVAKLPLRGASAAGSAPAES
jgi:Family of unknown function (DUF5808)